MKLLLKIHNKERHSTTVAASTAVTLFQRKPGRNNQNRGLPSNEPTTLRQERYFIYGALIFFAIVGFSTAIYFIVNQAQSADGLRQPRDILFGENYNPRTIPTLGNSHMIIDRNNWGTQDDVQATVRLERPVPYVVVTHIGVKTKNCTDIYQCSNKMRILQDAAIGERYLPDIPSNFYIGGDGNIYVGRGWDIANSYHNRTVSICFMGDYNVNAPLESQLSALQHLLTYGVVQDVLSKDFRLVARRQTKNSTKSPGDKLYPRIVQLSRWNPCGTQSYTHCGAELGFPSLWDDEMLYNKHGNNNQNNLLLPNTAKEMKYERYIVYSVILLFVVAGLLVVFFYVYQTYQASQNARTNEEIFFGNNFISKTSKCESFVCTELECTQSNAFLLPSKTVPNLGNGHMIIDRSNWGAQQNIRGPYDLTHPIPYVLITHIGVHAKNCTNVHMCSIKMRTLQDAAIAEKSLQDIPSNFYLGGDGNVYVGRGWDTANAYANRTLAVCFMGDYGRYEPNELQFSALDHLLTYGEKNNLLTKDYRVVAHRQMHSTRSPGIKLYEKIIQLARWNPCGLQGHEKCGKEIGLPDNWRQEYTLQATSLPGTTTTELSTTSGKSETQQISSR
ncbi:AGAP005205-PC-like protein [Anopheles sinensis]|uniref:AGAP005205-PC-like protein n=1 Tax=Anopheles sinensis TaxID=74873 RepID=A0A084WKV2_ANOSI|nr:AGAP005205-PC-like protein [Anopheles sinensis]